MKQFLICCLFLDYLIFVYCRKPCVHRDFGYGSTVCVCNLTYCDNFDALTKTPKGIVKVWETSQSGDRFEETQLNFDDKCNEFANISQIITIDRRKRIYQKIIGFGGAFTDSTGINIRSLPQKLRDNIINDYFSETGIEYTLARVPIGGTDFSTYPYSYDDNHINDFKLRSFSLKNEDYLYKIPYIKAALKVSPHNLKLFGSPWAPPVWMKNNSEVNHGGYLIGEPGGKYYKTYANYFVKFLNEYRKNRIKFWGITIENEPMAGDMPNYGWNCLGFTPELQRDFIKKDLGPILERAGYGRNTISLMIFDDMRTAISEWTSVILRDKEAAKYVSGIAFHWYENTADNVVNLDETHAIAPTKYILASEACQVWDNMPQHVYLGSWVAFEKYANDIITDLNHWTSGWVDWNLVLDQQGGPNWVKNFVDSPIIVSDSKQEYYKQPIFYALGHYSKFLLPGSVRVSQTETTKLVKLLTTAFVRPDGGTVMIALNLSDDPIVLTINDSVSQQQVSHLAKPHSIQTYLYYF